MRKAAPGHLGRELVVAFPYQRRVHEAFVHVALDAHAFVDAADEHVHLGVLAEEVVPAHLCGGCVPEAHGESIAGGRVLRVLVEVVG